VALQLQTILVSLKAFKGISVNTAQVMNLGQLLTQTAKLYPTHIGLVQSEQHWTWAQINDRVNAMVSALRELGVTKGDKILVQSRNNLQLFESCWVAFSLGCVWVPTNFRLTPTEVSYLSSSSGAKILICEDIFPDHIDAAKMRTPSLSYVISIGTARDGELNYESLVSQHIGCKAEHAVVEYDDPLWFFYTSGTTGKPKAGILTHGQMAFVVTNHLADLIPGTTEKDCSIAVAPLSHGAGIHALLNVARGASTVLMPSEKLDPENFWQLVEKHKVTNLFTVPTIVKILVEHESVDRYDHSSLRYMIYAGAPMYRADQKLALQKLGLVLVQYFGLGEVTGCITVLPPSMHSEDDTDQNANIGSCGKPRTGMEVAILNADLSLAAPNEIGEICCRGPAVFVGYHADSEATEKALLGGWFHTGDLGKLDERGLLYITGRQSDMYISGGSNVYPKEVEEVLLTHLGVAEVAIVGMPDPKWGEIGVAVVVRREQYSTLSADQLFAHLDNRCARYRWPRHFVFWPTLPKSGYGKVAKKDIKALLVETGY
jgi:fatty-acyl-CoA synthase